MTSRKSNVGAVMATIVWWGPWAYAVLIVMLGLAWRGYDPVRDSMSVLGAVDSPVRDVANYAGFAGLGVVLLCFAAYGRWFGITGLATVAVALMGIAAVEPALGLVQRIGIGLSLAWVSATGWRLRQLFLSPENSAANV